MGKYIYKITNILNGKAYIGQSNNPKRRFTEHKNIRCKETSVSLIGRAITKYGAENFSFEILGYFEDYNQKERDYIEQFGTLFPNGYNLQKGGEEPPVHYGEDNWISKLTQEKVDKIIEAILDWDYPRREIIKDLDITQDMFRHINEGTAWRKEDLNYPLRPPEAELIEKKARQVKKMLKETNLSQKEIAKQVKLKRSFVTMINIGKNHFDENETYPLRKTYKERNFLIKKLLLETTLSMVEIAKKTNSDYQSVYNICHGKTWYDKNLKYPLR